MRLKRWLARAVSGVLAMWACAVFAPPGVPNEMVAYWNKTLGALVKTDTWKKHPAQHGWFDAYADAAAFRKDLDTEEKIYAQIPGGPGPAKGLKK